MNEDSILRVSLVQGDTVWHDAAANREYYGSLVRPLAGDTDLVVLPEAFSTGFSNDAVELAEGMDGEGVAWLRALAQEVGAVVTGSMVIREGGRVFNRLLWAEPDGSLAHYDKRHLFRMADEHKRYAPGHGRIVCRVKGWRVCPLVCYDLRFPVYSRNRFDVDSGQFDYDLLLYVANWPAPRRGAWTTLLAARAIENLAFVAGVNRVGSDGNGIAYAGDSVVRDHLGEPRLLFGSHEQVATTAMSLAELASFRERFPAHHDADRFQLDPG